MTLRERFYGELYAITCSERSRGRSLEEVVRSMLESGIKIIQYREKNLSKKKKLAECLWIRKVTNECKALFIVNDDIDLTLASKADGIHLGQTDLPVSIARKQLAKNQIIGLSTHCKSQAEEACQLGVDYIGVGPIYATDTKEDVVSPVGLSYLKYVADQINLPFVAIGGIKEHNLSDVINAGATTAALVTEITEAKNISQKISRLKKIMQSVNKKREKEYC